MSTNKVNEWRIYCITEGIWSTGWLPDTSEEPTVCFNNTTHEVNPDSCCIINNVSQDTVKITQEKIATQGNFRNETFCFTVAPSTTQQNTIQFPYTINLLAVMVIVGSANLGDSFSARVDTGIPGTLSANVASGVNIIPVDSTIIEYFNIGFNAVLTRLSDNTIQDLGEVTAIDTNANTITTINSTTQTFSSGDKVSINIIGIKNMQFINTGTLSVGRSVLGSTYIPTFATIYANYTNNSASSKLFAFTIEYLY